MTVTHDIWQEWNNDGKTCLGVTQPVEFRIEPWGEQYYFRGLLRFSTVFVNLLGAQDLVSGKVDANAKLNQNTKNNTKIRNITSSTVMPQSEIKELYKVVSEKGFWTIAKTRKRFTEHLENSVINYGSANIVSGLSHCGQ